MKKRLLVDLSPLKCALINYNTLEMEKLIYKRLVWLARTII